MTSSCDMVWRATLSCLSCQSNAGHAEWSMRVILMNSGVDMLTRRQLWYSSRRRWTPSSCDLVWSAMLSCLSCQSYAGFAEWSMRVILTNGMSTDDANALSAVVKLAEEMDAAFLRHGVESHALLSSNAGYAEWSMRVIPTNSVSTDDADASSAVEKLAEEMDAVFLRHGVESYALLSLRPAECVPAYRGRETSHMCDVSHFCFFSDCCFSRLTCNLWCRIHPTTSVHGVSLSSSSA